MKRVIGTEASRPLHKNSSMDLIHSFGMNYEYRALLSEISRSRKEGGIHPMREIREKREKRVIREGQSKIHPAANCER